MPDLIVHQLRSYQDVNYSNYFLKYREIFPDVPVLLTGANEFENFMKMKLPDNYTGVFSKMDLKTSFDLILKVQPLTKKIYLVIGTTDLENKLLNKSLELMKKYNHKPEFEILNKQKVPQILKTIQNAQKNSVVLLHSFNQDIEKKLYLPDEMIRQLTKISTVPIYGTFYDYIENGSVGGYIYDKEIFGKKTAESSIEILSNKKKLKTSLKIISTS